MPTIGFAKENNPLIDMNNKFKTYMGVSQDQKGILYVKKVYYASIWGETLTGGNIAFTYVFEKAKCRGNPMKKNILSPKSIQQKKRSGAGGNFPLDHKFIKRKFK